MPVPPVDVPVNLTGQWILTVLVILALLVAAYSAVRMGRRMRSWAPAILLAGSLLAGFIEPIYSVTTHLWYYVPGQWSFYSALDMSHPIWSWLSYGAFYGGLSLIVWWRVEQGATRASIAKLFGVLVLVGVATEILCITLGTYEYYGEAAFRVAGFPMWISVANASIGIVAGIVAGRLRPLLPGRQSLAYVALIPVCMTGIQFGTGFLAIDVINTPDPATWLLYLTATISVALAATVAFVALKLVPTAVRADMTPIRADALNEVSASAKR
jgi:hypothetical protein